ncbi:VWA domain-containing protein [Chloroflexus sp.]|uniref:VWA domain-containing protein n=1 Tax=Chloroflexus sp. TaxID=1904827 RepID=UPI00404ACD1A
MKWYRILLVCLFITSLFAAPALAQTSDCRGFKELARRVEFPNVIVQFMVCDENGNPINNLSKSSVRINEDGKAITEFSFVSVTADNNRPVQNIPLIDGSMFTLHTVGASIGIVFDATVLLNGSGKDSRDSISEGRTAIEHFLLDFTASDSPAIRTKAEYDPERVAVFIPVDQQSQPLNLDSLPTFNQDRIAVVNALRTDIPLRQGKTNLYAAVQAAVEATARDAQQRNAPSIVLVVSDGGDVISSDTISSLINLANQKNVKIIAFGVGTDRALEKNGFRLRQLAEATGGRYFERPSPDIAGAAFSDFVQSRSTTAYEVSYRTSIFDDGLEHQVTFEVTSRSGNFSFGLPLRYPTDKETDVQIISQLNNVLLQYMTFGLPLAIVIAAVISGIFYMVRKRDVERGATQR